MINAGCATDRMLMISIGLKPMIAVQEVIIADQITNSMDIRKMSTSLGNASKIARVFRNAGKQRLPTRICINLTIFTAKMRCPQYQMISTLILKNPYFSDSITAVHTLLAIQNA
uniref:Uncharacterized protein n=1 Tax=Romanomermis culicivorax TaxID=13658 RepID=A0A915HVW4_ROMCU